MIYKLLTADEWAAFRALGRFEGSAVDLRDGFIHFSYADQLVETARRHFVGKPGLVLLAVDGTRLGVALRNEPSRGGALFPHLYGALSIEDILWDRPVTLDAQGIPIIPKADPA